MNPFLDETICASAHRNTEKYFALERSRALREAFSHMLSRHVGRLRSGAWFEAELLVVTGLSESGKSREIAEMLRLFHATPLPLPNGRDARIVQCILDRRGGWKDLGRKTLTAMGYELADGARLTQAEVWSRVAFQAKAQGIIGVHYDEAQHIFAGKADGDREMILDSFKTLLKTAGWPLMLIMSGIPELAGHARFLDQVHNKATYVAFGNIDLPGDYDVIHEIVGSYALENDLSVDADLMSTDFYHRLATAAAMRWGILFKMTIDVMARAGSTGEGILSRDHFVDHWTAKTGMNAFATPFTHDGYATMFRADRPFEVAVP